MDESERASKKRRKRKRWCIYILLLFLVAGAFTLFRLHLRSKLNDRIEAIRAAGYPVTCDELEAWYTIPEGAENAADTILDAIKSYHQWSSKTIPDANFIEPYDPFYSKKDFKVLPHIGSVKLPAPEEPLTEEMKALIAEYVVDNNDTLELLHTGAEIEHCRYSLELNDQNVSVDWRLGELRDVSRLLCFDALVHAENGNAELATRSVISGFGLARSLSKEPILRSQITLIDFDWNALYALKRIVNRIQLTDEQMIKLAEYIAHAEHVRDFSLGLIGEQCLKLRFFSEPRKWAFAEDIRLPPGSILKAYEALGLLDMDTIHYLDRMAEYIEVSRLPMHLRWEAARSVDDKFGVPSRIRFLLYITTFEISSFITVDFRIIARLRTARVGLAVQRYRLANGTLPDTLSQLVPEYLDSIPKDPFDSNELRYKKREIGFVIYSIGEDLSDDGGTERPQKRRGQTDPNWDVTFIVER
ncbi:MAG: hypothetical protein JXM79_01725 [Sedimentisphaerales bacterium]|nr:hypothetical protein [Sedimentisphaerales bacterium]